MLNFHSNDAPILSQIQAKCVIIFALIEAEFSTPFSVVGKGRSGPIEPT